jgi:hypothetical protein
VEKTEASPKPRLRVRDELRRLSFRQELRGSTQIEPLNQKAHLKSGSNAA